jgi:hypothetical protein
MGPNFAEMIFGREKIFKFVQMNMILLVKELVFRGFLHFFSQDVGCDRTDIIEDIDSKV